MLWVGGLREMTQEIATCGMHQGLMMDAWRTVLPSMQPMGVPRGVAGEVDL